MTGLSLALSLAAALTQPTVEMPSPFGEPQVSERAMKKRLRAIEELKRLLPKVKAPQMAQLQFRLAETYRDHGLALHALGETPAKADAYLKQASVNYHSVNTRHPTFERMDELLFSAAWLDQRAGRDKPAVRGYASVIKRFPESRYVSWALASLGDHYWRRDDIQRASKAYEQAMKHPDKVAASAGRGLELWLLYRLAWCNQRLAKWDKARSQLARVIEQSAGAESPDGFLKRLHAAAVVDLQAIPAP